MASESRPNPSAAGLPERTESVTDHLLRTIQPRHIDLARELLEEIARGRPPVGDLLPPELEICASTGLSRYSVRQAVQKLCELGVVERRAGIGTRVISRQPVTRYTQVMDTLNDLTRYAQNTLFCPELRRTILLEDAPEELRAASEVRDWYHIHGLRFSPDRAQGPIALVDIYLNAAFAEAPALQTITDQPVHRLVEQHYNFRFTRVDQVIQSMLIEGVIASRLDVPSLSPGLRILRSYFASDKLVEMTIGLHPAARFSYSMSFELTRPGG